MAILVSKGFPPCDPSGNLLHPPALSSEADSNRFEKKIASIILRPRISFGL